MYAMHGFTKTVAAAGSETVELGHYGNGFEVLDLHVSGTLTTGASVVISFEGSTDADTWYAIRLIDLSSTSLDTLAASVTKTSTFTTVLLRLAAFAPYVRVRLDNSGGSAAAVIAGHAVAVS